MSATAALLGLDLDDRDSDRDRDLDLDLSRDLDLDCLLFFDLPSFVRLFLKIEKQCEK